MVCGRRQRIRLPHQWFNFQSNQSARGAENAAVESDSGVLEFDQDVVVFDFDWVDGDFGVFVVGGFAGFWIVGPGVPGADDFAFFDHALPERAALVEAGIVHGGEFAVDVGDADFFVGAGEFFGFVDRGEFGFGGEFGEHTI